MVLKGGYLKVGQWPAPERGAFSAEPRQVQQWLAGLPMASPASAGKAIFEQLRTLAEVRLVPKYRFQMLETLLTPLDQIFRYMARAYVGKPFPLNVKSRNAGAIVREFCRLMARHYAQVAHDLGGFEGRVSLLHRGMNATALQRALWFMKKLQVNLYQLYSAYPTGFWLDLHGLHRAVERSGRGHKPVRCDSWEGMVSDSPLAIWYQCMVLAASNPYRLRPQTVAALEQFLQQWGPQPEICCGGAQQTEEGMYYFSPEVDAPPGRMSPPAQTSAVCSLNVRKLAAALPEPAIPAQESSYRDEFMDHLRQEWGLIQERSHQRLQGQHRLETLFGLSQVHYRLAGDMPFEKFVERTGIQQTSDDASLGSWLGRSMLDHEEVVHSVAQVLDQSLGGYRLRWSAEEVIRVQVGELVAMTLPGQEEDPDWVVGVVRWLNVNREQVDAGVQLLSHQCLPAVVRYKGRGQEATFLRALMLNGGPFQTPQQTVLLPAVVADQPENLLMAWLPDDVDVLDRRVERIRTVRQVERNQVFVQFDYEMEDTAPAPASVPEQQTSSREQEPELLWEDL